MKRMKLVAVGALAAALASCAVWRDRTVERTATDPVPDRTIPRASASSSSFTADYPRDERRAAVSQGGAGGSGGSVYTR
jgi:hypothetical protein